MTGNPTHSSTFIWWIWLALLHLWECPFSILLETTSLIRNIYERTKRDDQLTVLYLVLTLFLQRVQSKWFSQLSLVSFSRLLYSSPFPMSPLSLSSLPIPVPWPERETDTIHPSVSLPIFPSSYPKALQNTMLQRAISYEWSVSPDQRSFTTPYSLPMVYNCAQFAQYERKKQHFCTSSHSLNLFSICHQLSAIFVKFLW